MPLFRKAINYDDPQGPRFIGTFAERPPAAEPVTPLKVISYNIDKGREVDLALKDFNKFSVLQQADIIFLQEMDEIGTEKIARELRYNFVYYPASVMFGQNFGNAILSRWRITQDKKLILPHRSHFNDQIRIAVRAVVIVHNQPMLVYSVHSEIYTAPRRHRRNQVAAVVADIPLQAEYVIVGGDFNTVSYRSIRRLTRQFADVGLVRASKGAGPTVSKLKTSPVAADHIFTWGFQVVGQGKVKEAQASDHYPLWTKLRPIT